MPRQVRKCRTCGSLNDLTADRCGECDRTLPAEIITIPDPPAETSPVVPEDGGPGDATPADVASPPPLPFGEPAQPHQPAPPGAGGGPGGAMPPSSGVWLPPAGGGAPGGLQRSPFPPTGAPAGDGGGPGLQRPVLPPVAPPGGGDLPPDAPPEGTPLGHLHPGEPLFEEFVVEETIAPHGRSESGLYRCRDRTGVQWMVKVLGAEVVPRESLWRRLPGLRHQNLVVVERTGSHDGFFYEVQEYCEGGSLAEAVDDTDGPARLAVDVAWIRGSFLPQMLAALTYLHGQQPVIVHRDVKEANIYLTASGELKLGDFDIASELEATGAVHYTQRVRGTWVYSAPEAVQSYSGQAGQTVTPESDYYSLGVTIVRLLWGTTNMEQAHPDGIELPDAAAFFQKQERIAVPERLPDDRSTPEDLALLLRGLLIRNCDRRWGREAVERWLRGETSEEDRLSVDLEPGQEYLPAQTAPLEYKDVTGDTFQAFARSMLEHRETAAQGLEDGGIQQEIESKRGEYGATLARGMAEAWQGVVAQGGSRALAVYAAALRLYAGLPLMLPDGSEFPTYDDVRLGFRKRDGEGRLAFVDDEGMDHLAVWLELGGAQLTSKALAVRAVKVAEQDPGLRLESLHVLLLEEPRTLPDGFQTHTPEEYCRHALGDAAEWDGGEAPEAYRMALEDWRGRHLEAWLRGLGSLERADETRRQREAGTGPDGIASEAAFEAVLRQLDPGLPRVVISLDMTGRDIVHEVSAGRTTRIAIPYSSSGPGYPFGAWALLPDTVGASLESHTLESRQGQLLFSLDAVTGVEAGEVNEVEIRLRSGNAVLGDPDPAVLRFRVSVPQGRTVAVAAVVGAVLLGLPRLAVLLLGGDAPVDPFDFDWQEAWRGAFNLTFPNLAFVVGVVALAAAAYAGYRLILWAWARF